MPFFADARREIVIHDGFFADVQGNVVTYNVQSTSETGITQLAKEIAESVAAFHDSAERDPPPQHYPDSQNLVLAHILQWIEGDNQDHKLHDVLWLHGPAGVGKSAIAQTVAEHRADNKELAASFFFLRDKPGCNTARFLWATIAFQIAISIPALRKKIGEAVEKDPTICHKSHLNQLQKLIIDPFTSMRRELEVMNRQSRLPFLIIIDGLDGCNTHAEQCEVVRSVAQITNIHHLPLRFLITSRSEDHIRTEFNSPTLRPTCSHIIHSEPFPPEHDSRWQAFRSTSGSRWKPFFDSDMSPTPIFTTLMDNLFSYLDSSNSGLLYPEVISGFLEDSGCPPRNNIWKSTSRISESMADKILKEIYDASSVEYVLRQRAQAPQVSPNPYFGNIFNSNQTGSRVMPSFTPFPSAPVPLLTRKGFRDVVATGVLCDPAGRWRPWNLMLKKYDLPQYKGWGDLPRNVLPDRPDQRTVDRMAEAATSARVKITQESTAERMNLITSHYNNTVQMLDGFNNPLFRGI